MLLRQLISQFTNATNSDFKTISFELNVFEFVSKIPSYAC